jgi:hypothetical protein
LSSIERIADAMELAVMLVPEHMAPDIRRSPAISTEVHDQFAHDYPDSAPERFERLQAANQAAGQLLAIMMNFETKLSSSPRH